MEVKTSGVNKCNLCSLTTDALVRGVADYNTNKQVDILLLFSYIPFSRNSNLPMNIVEYPKVRKLYDIVKTTYPDKSVGVTSIIKCATYDKAKNDNQKICTDNHLNMLFKRNRPKIIIAIGSKASSAITHEKNLEMGDKLPTRYGDCKLVYMTDLSEMDRDYNYTANFEDVVANMFSEKETFAMNKFNIDILTTGHEMELAEKEILKAKNIFLDIEASTIPFRKISCGNKIMCASFTIKKDHAYVLPLRSCVSMYNNDEALHLKAEAMYKTICESTIPKTGHNLKYDSLMSAIIYNIVMRNFKYDTMYMHYLYDERPPHGLKELCDLYVPKLTKYSKTLDDYILKHPECDPKKGGSYFYIPNSILMPYNGLDTIADLEIFEYFYDKVYSNPKWKWLLENVMLPATKVYMQMEYAGFQTNHDELVDYGAKLYKNIIKYNQDISKFLISKGLSANLNMNSPEQIADVFIKIGEVSEEELKTNTLGKKTCDDKVVTALLNKGSHFAYLVNGLKKTIKKKSTYVDNYLIKCDAEYRLHGSFAMHFTDTGRSSCSDPNLQNIPPELKKFLIPKPGHILIERDFSQLELRLMACRTKDPVMLAIYARNEDIHKMTAASSELIVNDGATLMNVINNGDIDEIIKYITTYYKSLEKGYAKKLRQKAKAPNFHFIYGGYYKSLVKRINTDIDKMIKTLRLTIKETTDKKAIDMMMEQIHHLDESKISEEEAKNFEDAFFTLYKEIKTYHNDVDDFVKTYGYVYSPFGRIKHLPAAMLKGEGTQQQVIDACNAAKNHWIQSCGADCKYLSLIKLQRELVKRGMDSTIVSEVHDSIIAEVPIKEAFDYFDLSAECMDNWHEVFPEFLICKIPSDAKICVHNWSSGVEVANKAELEALLKAEKLI